MHLVYWAMLVLFAACIDKPGQEAELSETTAFGFVIQTRDSLDWGTSLPHLYTEYYPFHLNKKEQYGGWPALSYLKNGVTGIDTFFASSPLYTTLKTPVFEGADWFVNWADIPKIASFALDTSPFGSSHFASILQRSAEGTYDYNIITRDVRIGDGKYSLGFEKRLHDHEGPGEHGFVSYATTGDTIHAFWLDGRATVDADKQADHAHGFGAMQLHGRFITSNGVWGADRLIDDSVCDCCPTDAAITSNGPIVVYRDRSENEVRDIFRALPESPYPPAPIHIDGWEIGGCPVNGPAVASTLTGDTVAVVWYTEATNRRGIYLAMSYDGGINFGDPIDIATGKVLGRVDVAFYRSNQLIITFFSQPSGTSSVGLELACYTPATTQVTQITLDSVVASRNAGIPRVLTDDTSIHVAYTEVAQNDSTRVKLLQLN